IDHVRAAALDRLDQRGDVGRVVLHVGILDDRNVAVGMRDGSAHRGSLAPVLLTDEDDVVTIGPPGLDEVSRPIRRTVVYDDDLLLQVESVDAVEDLDDRRRLVVGGYEECDTHGGAAYREGETGKPL